MIRSLLRWPDTTLIAIGVLLYVAALPAAAQNYLVRHYTVDDGLPSSQIQDITQDALGRMWLATRSGVAVYDGSRWFTYNLAHGLSWADVFALRWDSRGVLWSVSSLPPFKVSVFEGDEWRTVEGSPEVAPESRITAFAVLGQASGGWLVVGTDRQGLRLRRLGEPTAWYALSEDDGLPSNVITAFGIDGERLLVATAAGLVEVRDGRLDDTAGRVVPPALFPVVGLARDERKVAPEAGGRNVAPEAGSRNVAPGARAGSAAAGRWWLLGRDWIGRLEGGRLSVLADPQSFPASPGARPMAAVSDRHGGLYFGHGGGLFHFHPDGGVEPLDRANGLLDNGTSALFVDREGSLWVAGPGGLSKLLSRWFGWYSRSHGLFDDEVTAVLERRDGTLVLGHHGGLSFLDGIDIRTRELRPAARQQRSRRLERVRDLAEDRQGDLWAAADTFGLARLDNHGNVTWFGTATTPLGGTGGPGGTDRAPLGDTDSAHLRQYGASEAVSSVRLDSRGGLWVGTTQGLYRRRPDRPALEGRPGVDFEKVPFDSRRIHVRRLFEGPDGGVLLASADGLYRYSDSDGWRHWTCDGDCSSVFAVLPAADGDLWVGTSVGLYHLAAGRLVKVPDPTIERPVYFLVRDRAGRVWLGIDNGVLRWDGRRLEHFTVRDGLAGGEINRAAGLADSRGRVWIGTERGLTRYFEQPPEPALASPIVALTHLEAAGKRLPLTTAQELEYDPHNMIFHFRAVSLVDEDRIEIASRLEGMEAWWQEPRALTVAEIRYTNLAPGSYRLHLRARSAGGAWSEPVTSATITVARPFWNRPWFYLALAVALGGGLYAAQWHLDQRRYSRRLESEVADRVAQLRSEIEERRRTQAELLVAKEAAESATRAKSQFLANMSHEIRTPLNAVIGMAQLLARERLDGRSRQYAETIFKSGDSLLHLVNEILDFSKIDSGVREIESRPFDLARCVGKALEIVAPRAAAKGLELIHSIDARCPLALLGDRHRLERVLVNLLDNAIKFTHTGEVTLRVADAGPSATAGSAGEAPAPHVVRFEVRDTGIGIDPEQLPSLFEPFTQADASTTRRYGGTGLGLTICKQLVELMAGSIQATSEPGKGSCFTFTITAPVSPEPPVPRGPSSRLAGKELLTDGEAACRRADGRSLHLLVAEDNPVNQAVVAMMLTSMGHRVKVVGDGQEALTALEESSYDAVLLDVQMPTMDGLEASRRICRRWSAGDRPRLIAVTAHASEQDRERCLAAGMDDFLTKPIRFEPLRESLPNLE